MLAVLCILCVNKIDKLKDKQAVLPFLADIGKKYQPDDLFPLSAFNKPDTKALRALILKYLG
jgi:GTPase Era involved in 16S rRNA processing